MRLGTGEPTKYDFHRAAQVGAERATYLNIQIHNMNISTGNTINTASSGAVLDASSTSNSASGGSALATGGATAAVSSSRVRTHIPPRVLVSMLGFGIVVVAIVCLPETVVQNLKLGHLEIGSATSQLAGMALGVLAIVAPWIRVGPQPR